MKKEETIAEKRNEGEARTNGKRGRKEEREKRGREIDMKLREKG